MRLAGQRNIEGGLPIGGSRHYSDLRMLAPPSGPQTDPPILKGDPTTIRKEDYCPVRPDSLQASLTVSRLNTGPDQRRWARRNDRAVSLVPSARDARPGQYPSAPRRVLAWGNAHVANISEEPALTWRESCSPLTLVSLLADVPVPDQRQHSCGQPGAICVSERRCQFCDAGSNHCSSLVLPRSRKGTH
jgi:hypothetical protein